MKLLFLTLSVFLFNFVGKSQPSYNIWTNSNLKIIGFTSHKVKVLENLTPAFGKTNRYFTNTIIRVGFKITNLPKTGSFSITSGSGSNILDLNGGLYHSRISVNFDESYTNIVEQSDYLSNDLTVPQPKIKLTLLESMGGYRHDKTNHSITTWIGICYTNQFPEGFRFVTSLPKTMPTMLFWKLHVIEYVE
jgi:hypothetical protein